MPFFRTESEDARANAWLGKVLLTRPLSFTLLTAASLALVAAVGSFFAFGEYTRKARLNGMVAPVHGVVRIVAPQAGVVHSLGVEEGTPVEPGDPIITLADARGSIAQSLSARMAERFHALVMQREHVLSAMRAEQAQIARRRRSLDHEVAMLGAELATQARRAALASQGLDRALGLQGSGFISPAAVDRERDAVLEQESRGETMRRARSGLLREAEGSESEAASAFARAQAQVAAIDAQLAALGQERIERQLQYRATIVAPAGGAIATILVEPGQAISPGMTVATLIPAGDELEAQLFASSRSIGFVKAGQQVSLRYLAYPHQKFGSHVARITAVARNPMLPAELGFAPLDGSREPLYRIRAEIEEQTIEAYGKREPLQVGMQLEADVRLDRRRLIEWIFEPLLSLSGRA